MTSPTSSTRGIWGVIAASSAGTVIEWYDFYIFGSLAAILSAIFYPEANATISLLKWLATFAAGFAVRPFGALVFGRIGDMVGRKYAFMLTLLIMGGSTAAIGLLPGYGTLGIFAPVLLVSLRLLQGLALGGEYGGAAIYVAEHAPEDKRGFYTSFIQTTATLGFFVGICVSITSIGAGSLTLPLLLVFASSVALRRLVGTDLAFAVVVLVPSLIGHWKIGDVNPVIAASLLLGSIPGVFVGTHFVTRLPERMFRGALAGVLVIVALALLPILHAKG